MTDCGRGDWVDTVDGIVVVVDELAPGLIKTYDLESHATHVVATRSCRLLACCHTGWPKHTLARDTRN